MLSNKLSENTGKQQQKLNIVIKKFEMNDGVGGEKNL